MRVASRIRRLALVAGVTMMVVGGTAQAQTPSGVKAPEFEYQAYVEGTAQASFGNQTSQSYGAELGYKFSKNVDLFVDLGQIRNAATPTQGASALAIAGYLSQIQSNPVTFTAKEPVAFGLAGVKYSIPLKSPLGPYAMVGLGVARVTQDVHFLVSGSDVTSNLTQFGVVLGSDLSGSTSHAMMTLGVGAVLPAWQRVIVDIQYRFGRIFNGGESISVSRAGLGLGIRF